jgi:hypothetical protein
MLFAVAVVIAVTLEDHNLLVVSVPVVVSIPIVIVMPVLLYDYRFLSVCRSDWQRQRYDAEPNDSQNEIAHFISSMVARCSTQTNSKPFHEQTFIATDFEDPNVQFRMRAGVRFSGQHSGMHDGEWGG